MPCSQPKALFGLVHRCCLLFLCDLQGLGCVDMGCFWGGCRIRSRDFMGLKRTCRAVASTCAQGRRTDDLVGHPGKTPCHICQEGVPPYLGNQDLKNLWCFSVFAFFLEFLHVFSKVIFSCSLFLCCILHDF